MAEGDTRHPRVTGLGEADEGYGKFAWILDPDGVKIELWEQVDDAPPDEPTQ